MESIGYTVIVTILMLLTILLGVRPEAFKDKTVLWAAKVIMITSVFYPLLDLIKETSL